MALSDRFNQSRKKKFFLEFAWTKCSLNQYFDLYCLENGPHRTCILAFKIDTKRMRSGYVSLFEKWRGNRTVRIKIVRKSINEQGSEFQRFQAEIPGDSKDFNKKSEDRIPDRAGQNGTELIMSWRSRKELQGHTEKGGQSRLYWAGNPWNPPETTPVCKREVAINAISCPGIQARNWDFYRPAGLWNCDNNLIKMQLKYESSKKFQNKYSA